MADNLDPELQRQMNEEMQKFKESISSMVPAMVLMTAAMREQIGANKGLTGSQKEGSKVVDDWLKSQASETAATNASTQATKKYNDAMTNLNQALYSGAASLASLGKSLMSVDGGMAKYSSSVASAGDAAYSAGKALGPLGMLFGGLAKVLSRIVGSVLEFNDNMLKGTDSLSKMGAIGDITTTKFREMGARAGYSVQRLDEFAGVIKGVGTDIIGLGGTAAEGAKAFAKLAEADETLLQQYSRLGVTQTQLNKNQADYIKLQITSGQQITERSKQDGSLRKASMEYTDNLLELSSLSGMEVDDIKKKQEMNRQDLAFSTRLALMQDKEIALRTRGEETGNQEMIAQANRIKQERENMKALQDVAGTMGMSEKEMAGFNSMLATGNFNELSAGFAAGTPGILEFMKAVKEGKKSPEELRIFMAEATAATRKSMGEAIIQNKEIGDSVAYSAGLIKNEAKYRGMTVEQQKEMIEKDKAERDKQRAGGADAAKDARAQQQTTERRMQLAGDSMVATIQGPITKAFEFFQKALGLVAKYLAKFAVWLGAPDFTDMFKTPEEVAAEIKTTSTELNQTNDKIAEIKKAMANPAEFKKELQQKKEAAEKSYMEQAQQTEDLKKKRKESNSAEEKALLDKQITESKKQEQEKKQISDTVSLQIRNSRQYENKELVESKLLALEKQKLELEEKKKSQEGRAQTLSASPEAPKTAAGTSSGMSGYLQKVAQVESGGKADAKAKTSSASGLFQFTEGTWKQTTKEMGKSYSLEDRFDPVKSAEVAKFFTEKQKAQVEKGTGKAASDADLYMAHFLGAGGATKFLNAMAKNPNALATEGADPQQIEANKSIFYEDGGKGKMRTLQEVYSMMARKIDKAGETIAEGKGGKDIDKIQAARSGGIFSGSEAGYPVMLHGKEIVIPLPDANSLSVEKQELGASSSSSTTTNNESFSSDSSAAMMMEIFEMMSQKMDDMINKLTDSNDIQDQLLKVSRV